MSSMVRWWGTLLMLTVLQASASIEHPINVGINIHGTVIDTGSCTFSGQKPLQIEYGDVYISELTPGNNNRKLEYTLKCSGNPHGKTVEMKFQGTGADFDNQLLQTDVKGLGIKIFKNTSPQAINSWFSIESNNPPKLVAELIKQDGATFQNGQAFNAAMTLVVEYR
ncbi:fimbrial protein [Enterobacter bugandensis]|uniref:fimbrial protein n=1 Tax=Enterobacter bugandensis TaxID=881260 RepID=UPI0020065454|nr:fimbrial protein [Enterobacter bugandensis]MCK6964554.1 fimbrial protein [Enterobacter bugandensis]